MSKERNWSDFVKKLVSETKNNKVTWNEDPRIDRDEIVGHPYTTELKGHHLLCYEYKYPITDESGDPDWVNAVAVELIEEDGTVRWLLPATPFHPDLLDAIRYQTSDATDLYDQFFAE